MLKLIKQWINKLKANDPVYSCPVYKSEGCSHVDGLLCDFPECDIIKKTHKE